MLKFNQDFNVYNITLYKQNNFTKEWKKIGDDKPCYLSINNDYLVFKSNGKNILEIPISIDINDNYGNTEKAESNFSFKYRTITYGIEFDTNSKSTFNTFVKEYEQIKNKKNISEYYENGRLKAFHNSKYITKYYNDKNTSIQYEIEFDENIKPMKGTFYSNYAKIIIEDIVWNAGKNKAIPYANIKIYNKDTEYIKNIEDYENYDKLEIYNENYVEQLLTLIFGKDYVATMKHESLSDTEKILYEIEMIKDKQNQIVITLDNIREKQYQIFGCVSNIYNYITNRRR